MHVRVILVNLMPHVLIHEFTLKPVPKKSVSQDPWVEIERLAVLRAEKVRVLEVRAAELVRVHADGRMLNGVRENQLGVGIKRPTCWARIGVQKSV